jgi:hypothetical protein
MAQYSKINAINVGQKKQRHEASVEMPIRAGREISCFVLFGNSGINRLLPGLRIPSNRRVNGIL